MHIRKAIANDLSIPESFIIEAVKLARLHVKVFEINKRSGGTRKIFHPSKKLKTIQYWLIHKIFCQIPIHDASMAYRDNISILHNAKKHSSNRFFLKLDLENFFPSISFNDVIPIIRKWYETSDSKWTLDDEAESLIKKVCFYKNDQLAIGYPSSPIISNIVMGEFDSKVTSLISDKKFGNVIYTRYADDLVFSTDKKGVCSELHMELDKLIKATSSPNIHLNESKTRFSSSTGGSAFVTGLRVCSGGHITIHRKQKDHIRLLLSLYKKGKLRPEDKTSLLGHLSYCQHVAPDFYTKLCKKFFKEINHLRTN